MKKTLLSLIFVAGFGMANAQVIMSESFESSTFPPAGWSIVNNAAGNDWALNDFEPLYASDGVQSMYYEYNSAEPADAWAFTPALSLTAGDSVVLTFDYVVASDYYPESMKVTMGNDQTVAGQTTILWDSVNLINTSIVTASIGIHISTTGNYNFGFNCYSAADMYYLSVDNIQVRKVQSNDLKLNPYIGITRGCDFLPTGQELAIDVSNIGGADQSNFPIGYRINSGTVVSEIFTGTLAAGATANYVYLAGADFSTPGTYTVEMFTQLNIDGDQSNDTTRFTVLSEASGLMVKTSLDTVFIPDEDTVGLISALPFCGIANNLGTNIRIKQLTINGINHTWDDDIDLTLYSPMGDSLVIAHDIGGSNPDYPVVTFTDTASVNIIVFDEDVIVAGYYHTQDSAGFAKFNGQDPNGMWRLRVADDAGADVGYLISWTLEFDNAVGITELAHTSGLVHIYPNPNNGVFVIESNAGKNMNMKISNITGATVKELNMQGNTKQDIDLRDLAKGMYFVTATTAQGVQTTKVIIE